MTSSYGVMDFNTLKKENQTGGTSDPLEGEVAVNEANLESLIKDSDQHLTILFVTSARVNGGAAFTDDLRSVLAKYAGTIRLAILDADQQPRVAAALRIQSLPTAVLLMKGQIQPLFEGVVTKEQLAPVMDELAGLAAKEGMHTEAPRETRPSKPRCPKPLKRPTPRWRAATWTTPRRPSPRTSTSTPVIRRRRRASP